MKRAGGRVDHAGRCKVAAEVGRPKLKKLEQKALICLLLGWCLAAVAAAAGRVYFLL
jgi:hypothetical protein